MISTIYALLLTLSQPGSQAWAQVVDRTSKKSVGLIAPALTPQRLMGIFWADGSLPFASSALQAPPATVAAGPAPQAATALAGPGAGAMLGCGFIQISRGNPPVPAAIENPIFIEGKRLLDDPRFGSLSNPVREKYLGEWKGLHQMQEKLDREGQGVTSDLDAADKELSRLDALGCRVKDVIDRLEPSLTTYNRICQGNVDQHTFDWCKGEQIRLTPLVADRDLMQQDLFRQMADYSVNVADPVLQKADLWAGRVTKWEGKAREFNEALKGAFATRAPTHAECQSTIKLLTQYERLVEKFGVRLSPGRVQELDRLRDSGEIRKSDLPGTLQREFPGIFDNMTLLEIRQACSGGGA